jgi:hypothetical protein
MGGGRRIAVLPGAPAAAVAESGASMALRHVMAVWVTLALILVGLSVGRASDRDETVLTVQVSSADHELQEGYFTLGNDVTVMVKPGSDLHRFLTRQRGRKVKISLTDATAPELSRLNR